MIFFLVTEGHPYPIELYLGTWGRALAGRLRTLPYERLGERASLPAGAAYVFSDIERLGGRRAEIAARLWQELAERGGGSVRLLNHPTRSMRRYELLRALHERGVNRSNAYRLTEWRRPARFPVFLRVEDGHEGPLTPLLRTERELDEAAARIALEGWYRDRVLVVEFCDTADRTGIFRKYSAFNVGGRIVPRHLFFSRSWMVKERDLVERDLLAEERRYVEENPHRRFLEECFELARIDYGRIDYALKDGAPQVFEINTNPMTMAPVDSTVPGRYPVHELFARGFGEALEAIDAGADRRPSGSIPIAVEAEESWEGPRARKMGLFRKIAWYGREAYRILRFIRYDTLRGRRQRRPR